MTVKLIKSYFHVYNSDIHVQNTRQARHLHVAHDIEIKI